MNFRSFSKTIPFVVAALVLASTFFVFGKKNEVKIKTLKIETLHVTAEKKIPSAPQRKVAQMELSETSKNPVMKKVVVQTAPVAAYEKPAPTPVAVAPAPVVPAPVAPVAPPGPVTVATASPVAAPPIEAQEKPVEKVAAKPIEKTPILEVPKFEEPQFVEPSGLTNDMWIYLGGGLSFTSLNQTTPGFSNIDFGGISTSNISARGGFWFSENHGLEFNYRDTGVKVKSSPSVSVSNGNFRWKTMSVETLFRSNYSPAKKSEWVLRAGLQQQEAPLLVPTSLNSIDARKMSITSASLGFDYKKLLRKKFRTEWMARYSIPIASSGDMGASYKAKNKMAIDHSFGAVYQVRENFYFGMHWYTSYQSYSYTYQEGVAMRGNQSLFFTGVDLRLGFEF